MTACFHPSSRFSTPPGRYEERDLDGHLFQQSEPFVHLTRAGIVEAQTDGGALPCGPTKDNRCLAGPRCQQLVGGKAQHATDPNHEESPPSHRVHLSSLVVAHYGSPERGPLGRGMRGTFQYKIRRVPTSKTTNAYITRNVAVTLRNKSHARTSYA